MTKKIYTAIVGALLLAGCAKDPSNVAPTDAFSTSNYPSSLDGLNSVLAPCFSNMRDQGFLGFHFLPKALSNCMHTINTVYAGDPSWNDMSQNNVSPTNTYAIETWQVMYTGIKNCNVTLQATDFFKKNYAKANDMANADYIAGQALILRAFYYMELECLYGESYITANGGGDKMGVPIFTSVPKSIDSTQRPRATAREVWDLIISDLKTGAELLKGKSWAGDKDNFGRPTEWSAKGLLGKAYVYTQDWANAKAVLQDVINNSGKSLMPYAKYRDAFVGISANEFNEESLLELNVDADPKGNDYGIYGGKAANATTINGLIWCPWALGNDGKEASNYPMGYGNSIFHDRNIIRFGYTLGTYTLVDNTHFDASKPASATNPKQVMDPTYKTNALAARTNNTVDPRLYVNALQPWVDSVNTDGKGAWAPVGIAGFYVGQAGKYGFSVRKYATIFNNINNLGPAEGNNFYLLRLADVYLLYAEALHNSGDDVNALEYINKIKRRAYNYPVDAASPVDYASLTAATPANVNGDPVLGHNPLYYERWAELFNEGSWWFDVCRWKIGKSEAEYFQNALNVTESLPSQWSDSKSYTWPIPITELNSNAKIAGQQNPGYK